MPKYEIKATLVIEAEAVIEAKDFDEAVVIASELDSDGFILSAGDINLDSITALDPE